MHSPFKKTFGWYRGVKGHTENESCPWDWGKLIVSEAWCGGARVGAVPSVCSRARLLTAPVGLTGWSGPPSGKVEPVPDWSQLGTVLSSLFLFLFAVGSLIGVIKRNDNLHSLVLLAFCSWPLSGTHWTPPPCFSHACSWMWPLPVTLRLINSLLREISGRQETLPSLP